MGFKQYLKEEYEPTSEWKQTRAGYNHKKSGWNVEMTGRIGVWIILTDKGGLSTNKRLLKFKNLETAIKKAEEVMKERGII